MVTAQLLSKARINTALLQVAEDKERERGGGGGETEREREQQKEREREGGV